MIDSRRRMGRFAVLRLLVAFEATLLASCAPHVVRPPELVHELRVTRYRSALSEREARGVAVAAEIVLWTELSGDRRLPGVQAELYLAAPDGMRLRVESLLGTALLLGARGDSVMAYVPARRMGLRVDAAHDSIGVRDPGSLAYRVLSATWRPPDRAWEESAWRDSLLEVSWVEAGDTLVMAVGGTGLPVWVAMKRRDGPPVRAAYRGWDRTMGTAWPSHLEIDQEGSLHLACRVRRVQFGAQPDPRRLVVRIPEDAETLTLDQLHRAIERLGAF